MFENQLKPYLPMRLNALTVVFWLFAWTLGMFVPFYASGLIGQGIGIFHSASQLTKIIGLVVGFVFGVVISVPTGMRIVNYLRRNVIGYVARIHVSEDGRLQTTIWTKIWTNARKPQNCGTFSSESCLRWPRSAHGSKTTELRVQLGGWRKTQSGFIHDMVLPEKDIAAGTTFAGVMDGWTIRVVRRRGEPFLRLTDPKRETREMSVENAAEFIFAVINTSFHPLCWSGLDSWVNTLLSGIPQEQQSRADLVANLIGLLTEIDGTTRLIHSEEGRRVRNRLWLALSTFSQNPRIASLRECPVKPRRKRVKQPIASAPNPLPQTTA
ncbi:MAG: hypothetical protein V1778_04640 [bacterium]